MYVAVKEIQQAVVPTKFEEAVSGKDADQWHRAMDEEVAALHANNTWKIEQLPVSKRAIPCRWVFARKRMTATRHDWLPRDSCSGRGSTSRRLL